jgi:photosystem II stability/assembly factor-like uncharacterized protein
MRVPLLLALAGCAAVLCSCSKTQSINDLRVDGFAPAEKPQGVIVEREEDEWEAGPAPYGYIRVTGEPVPNWTPGGEVNPAGSLMTWTFLGPRPMSNEYWSGNTNAGGRIAGIAPHPTNANICYIATASGGVWKTTDGGANWNPITDELSILNGGWITLDPSDPNTIYYGTGEYVQGSTGDGIFRSTDAGANWTRISTTAQTGAQISKIIVHPTNPQIIHVTSTGGYYRSTDRGATWSQRLSGNCSSLALDPVNPNNVYIARRTFGVYKSTDGGTTVAALTGGLPTSGFTYMSLSLANSAPGTIYAAFCASSGGGLLGLYKTTDGGVTWTQKTATPNFPSPQGSYNCYVAVDPANPDIAFVAGVDRRYAVTSIARTTNGGDSWTEMITSNNVHPDHHLMVWGPGPTIWEGNDGGVYKSTNGGVTWSNLNATLGAAQIYQIAVHPNSPNRMLGGTQDNGTPERTSNTITWPQLQAGDGGFSVFDPTNITTRYTTYVYATVYRWPGGTDISGGWGSDSSNFIAPLVGDPNSPTTLLVGTNRVWRTTNAATGTPTWTALSNAALQSGSTLNAVAVAPGFPNTIYAGTTGGRVYVTTNLTTWNNRSTGLPSGQVSDIVISPTDPNTAYVSFFNTTGNRILKTTNAGVSWVDATGALPSGVAARALAIDWTTRRPGIYVGSGAGIWASLNGSGNWFKDDASFPNVNVGDLSLAATTRRLTAGTYGRGAWQAVLPPICNPDVNGDGVLDFFDYLDFVAAFSANSAGADYNLDSVIDFFDYLDFVAEFSSGC